MMWKFWRKAQFPHGFGSWFSKCQSDTELPKILLSLLPKVSNSHWRKDSKFEKHNGIFREGLLMRMVRSAIPPPFDPSNLNTLYIKNVQLFLLCRFISHLNRIYGNSCVITRKISYSRQTQEQFNRINNTIKIRYKYKFFYYIQYI